MGYSGLRSCPRLQSKSDEKQLVQALKASYIVTECTQVNRLHALLLERPFALNEGN